jgi:chondroitin AC lyase
MTKMLPLALVLFCAPVSSFGLQPTGSDPHQAATVSASAIADLALIRNRVALSVLPTQPVQIEYVHTESEKFAAALQPDGSWSDIDYGDSALPSWPVTGHLERTLIMAKSARLYRNAGHPNNALETRLMLAIKHWTDHDYRNHLNPALWWWNEIGVPELIGETSILTWEQLPSDQLAKLIAIMKRSDWRRVPWTGANLTWGVINQIARGCMENNPDTVAEAYDRMYQEIRIVSPNVEGIQLDASFHQHGNQIYNGGYGLAFANDVGRFISVAWGTRYQIPPDRMAIFSGYLLDGEQWMIRGNVFDYAAVGRELARPGKVAVPAHWSKGPISPAGPAYSLGNAITMLAAQPTPRQKEFQGFAALLEEKPNAAEFVGNKQFWCSDFMAHRRQGYYASVKMHSTRIRNAELVNGEGMKSHHMSDGLNLLYLTGDEYKDIFPVWDWTKLPGTTTIQGTLDTGEKNPINAPGTTTFDGGVSDGTYGMAAMDLSRGKLTAKKAWFFFDSSYVALGVGITLSDDPEHDVVTDANQTHLVGDVVTSQSPNPITTGTQTYNSTGNLWVYHNHVGYIFAPNTKVSLSAGPQTGKWTDFGFMGSSQPVTKPVFDLWIDHGHSPQDATYQYTVFPNASAEQVAKSAKASDLAVLSNTRNIQAVYNSSLKLAEIAFREAGSLATPLGQIQVDHSCLLMVRQTAKGLKIIASNPENQPLTLNVTVKGKKVAIHLPDGDLAGSSATTDEL